MTSSQIFGFDSFEGLQKNWVGHESPKGSFDLAGKLPRVKENVILIKGWFDKTLPEFLLKYSDKISFIHIDSDTYEAARTVLALCKQRLSPGTWNYHSF